MYSSLEILANVLAMSISVVALMMADIGFG
jgi:hypothetical protein